MSYRFPSPEWTVAFKDAVNANAAYREAGKPWTYGPVALVIRAQADLGIPQDTGMLLDVHEGRCRGTQYVEGLEGVAAAEFIIIAEYAAWKSVLQGEVDPIRAMMEGQLDLRKGHLPTMIRFVEASRQLVASALQVPTEFIA